MSKVRQYHIGSHSDLSQEILAELARARLILIDPDRRAEYDAKLRARENASRAHRSPRRRSRSARSREGPAATRIPTRSSAHSSSPSRRATALSLRTTSRRTRSPSKTRRVITGVFVAIDVVLLGTGFQVFLAPRMFNRNSADAVRDDPPGATTPNKPNLPAKQPPNPPMRNTRRSWTPSWGKIRGGSSGWRR